MRKRSTLILEFGQGKESHLEVLLLTVVGNSGITQILINVLRLKKTAQLEKVIKMSEVKVRFGFAQTFFLWKRICLNYLNMPMISFSCWA